MAEVKSSDELLTTQIHEIREDIKRKAETVEKNVKDARKAARAVTKFFADHKYLEFEEPQRFRNALTDLSEYIGNAADVVLDIENKRATLSEVIEKKKIASTSPNPSLVQHITSAQPVVQRAAGFWAGYMGAKAEASVLKDVEKMKIQAEQQKPTITSEQHVIDILDFGRDLIPTAINKTLTYFRCALAQVHLYKGEMTKRVLHEDLATHCTKLSAIIMSFSRTAAEYRKKLLIELDMGLAKALSEVVTAQALGTERMSSSELFRAIRQGLGPQDAGK